MRWYRSKFDNIRSAPLRNIGAATIEAAHNRCPDKFRNPSEYQPERRIEGKGYESRDTNHRPTPGFAVEQTAEIAKSGSSQDQRNRRLARDFERFSRSVTAWVGLA